MREGKARTVICLCLLAELKAFGYIIHRKLIFDTFVVRTQGKLLKGNISANREQGTESSLQEQINISILRINAIWHIAVGAFIFFS